MKLRLSLAATLLLTLACSREEPASTSNTATAPEPAPAQTASAPPPAPACTPAANRLCPVDEGANNPSFAEYREHLLTAIRQKDRAALLASIDPNIRTSFGDGGGADEFAEKLDDARWTELEKVLTNGGTLRDGMFWAPYVYSAWPENVDAFQHVAALRKGVEIRKSAGGEVASTVDWAILELAEPPSGEWVHVKDGYVAARDVHSPVGYRAGFSNRSGRWLMEAFVAGD